MSQFVVCEMVSRSERIAELEDRQESLRSAWYRAIDWGERREVEEDLAYVSRDLEVLREGGWA